VAGAVIGAAITSWFNYLSHQNDLDAKMIELSVGILRANVTEETIPLRQWAIDVMNKRAKFQFNAEQVAVLLKQPLPSAGWTDYVYPDPGYTDYLLERRRQKNNPPRNP